MNGATGLGTAPSIENTQVIDFTQRQNRPNSHNRLTEVHAGYTACFWARVFCHLARSLTRSDCSKLSQLSASSAGLSSLRARLENEQVLALVEVP
jgi:hypothetical protein